MLGWLRSITVAGACMMLAAAGAHAQTRVTLKSATAGSSYYMMTVQLGEVLRAATNGAITATVEESQGSVQNVREAPRRPGNYVFTAPPGLVRDAQAAREPFRAEPGYADIRTLFVMPPITMHFVVRADTGIASIADLAGRSFVAGGRGTFTERETLTLFRLLGLEGRVRVVDIELNAAVAAMHNRQIDGFATGSTHPTSQVQELSATMGIRLLSLTAEQIASVVAADATVSPVTIAAGTYPNQAADVATFGLPVGAYATTRMDEQVAYDITRIFWARAGELARQNAWWGAVAPAQVAGLGIRLHPGAARYYAEAGVAIPSELR
jgi:TRAP transporter TAXI family solute receptor